MNDEVIELIERVERLSEELSRVKRAIIAASNGTPFTEAFDEELYLEASDKRDSCYSNLARMMQHLLKAKYSTDDSFKAGWIKEADGRFRDYIIDKSKWLEKRPDKNIVNHLLNNLQDIYDLAIKQYQKSAKEHSDLVDGIKLIPKECPWTLDELMDETIEYLLNKLY